MTAWDTAQGLQFTSTVTADVQGRATLLAQWAMGKKALEAHLPLPA